MKWLFWASGALIGYAYAGYPCWLWLRALLKPRPVKRAACEPSVSVLVVVRNEEAVLDRKLKNLLELDYPAGKLQIVAVSDGSSDASDAILSEYARSPRVHAVMKHLPGGKAAGLNDGLAWATGEIVVFTDARQAMEKDAVRRLMENFADPGIGAVSGELMLGDPASGQTVRRMGLYWRIEKLVRKLEAASGSVVGATGAIYAARRDLVPEVPADTILDDVFIPMNVARQGFRVTFDERARAWDCADLGSEREFKRKVRTLTGNYQLLQLAPWLLLGENPLRFEFVSHKLMRLVAPFLLVTILISAWLAPGALYRGAFWGQISFYALGLLGASKWNLGMLSRIGEAAYTFMALNAAAMVAFVNFVTGNVQVWTQPALGGEIKA